MTREEAFLRAVVLDPGDDAPRLVYADWLEEQGRYERAELIRVQCELARPGGACPVCDERGWQKCNAFTPQCRRKALRRREEELVYPPNGTLWAKGLRVTGWGVTYRRGFVEEVRCTTADWLEHGTGVVLAQPVTRVRLTDRDPRWGTRGRWLMGRLDCWRTNDHVRCMPEQWWPKKGVWFDHADFTSEREAWAWASDLCVDWARHAAGLPELRKSEVS
jgi:uncharacterized protein (TIGR02996 family)